MISIMSAIYDQRPSTKTHLFPEIHSQDHLQSLVQQKKAVTAAGGAARPKGSMEPLAPLMKDPSPSKAPDSTTVMKRVDSKHRKFGIVSDAERNVRRGRSAGC